MNEARWLVGYDGLNTWIKKKISIDAIFKYVPSLSLSLSFIQTARYRFRVAGSLTLWWEGCPVWLAEVWFPAGMEASSSIVSSAKASFPPLQPPRRPPATTPPTPTPTPPTTPPPPLPLPRLTLPMQPPSDLATPDGRLFCTRLEVTSSFTPDSSRRELPTYLRINPNQVSLLLSEK